MISVKNLTKRNGDVTVLENISLELDGGVLGVVSKKGGGKTTLLNIISCVERADGGEILIDGVDVTEDILATKRRVGYLQCGTPIYTDMTPCEYLTFYGSAKKIKSERLARQIDEVLELLGIEGARNVLIESLSPSDRQKVGIAQTLLGNPGTVLLDEPFARMTQSDVSTVKSVIRMLGQLKTVIITSDSLPMLADVCDKALVLSPDGHTLLGSPEEIADEAARIAVEAADLTDLEVLDEPEEPDETEGEEEVDE